jgi:hypothetical protein
MTTLERANELVGKLEAAGVRATTDPTVVAPPCVLFIPPNHRYDVGCGFTATWQIAAIAPAARTADRNTWATLEQLVTAVADIAPVVHADLVAYIANGVTYPAYLLEWEEALS